MKLLSNYLASILCCKKIPADPLLLKLNDTGTLYIQNIEYLSLETQNYLAEFILYGFFHKFKSDHKVFSNVRIICSTTKDLLELVNAENSRKLSTMSLIKLRLCCRRSTASRSPKSMSLHKALLNRLKLPKPIKTYLPLPIEISTSLFTDRPLSLREFKEKVHQLLVQKSTKHNIHETTNFDPAYNVTEPDIAHAVRLGKKALKDPQIMACSGKNSKIKTRLPPFWALIAHRLIDDAKSTICNKMDNEKPVCLTIRV